jgi:predicted O-methyltransferase YrrM
MKEPKSPYWCEVGHFNAGQYHLFASYLEGRGYKTCLEIGFCTGRSAYAMLEEMRPQKCVSIDIDLKYRKQGPEMAEKFTKKYPQFELILGDSLALLTPEFFDTYFPDGLDFAFVDGERTMKAAYLDLRNIYPFMSDKGALLMDDFECGPPKKGAMHMINIATSFFMLTHNVGFKHWSDADGKGVAILTKHPSIKEMLWVKLYALCIFVENLTKTSIFRTKRRISRLFWDKKKKKKTQYRHKKSRKRQKRRG